MKRTVARRIALLGGSALLGIVILAGVSYRQTGKVFDAASYSTTVPTLMVLNDIVTEFSRLRVRIYRHSLTSDAAKLAESETNTLKAAGKIDALLKRYESDGCLGAPCVSDEKDKESLSSLKAAYADYRAALAPVFEAARNGKNEQAYALVVKNVPLAQKVNAIIDSQIDYNAKLGKEGAKRAEEVQGQAVKVSIAITLTTVLALAAIGFLIARTLTRQLGGEPETASAIANRELVRADFQRC